MKSILVTLILIIYSTGGYCQNDSTPSLDRTADLSGGNPVDIISLQRDLFDSTPRAEFLISDYLSEFRYSSQDSIGNYIAVSIDLNTHDTSIYVEGDTALAIISVFTQFSKILDQLRQTENERDLWKQRYSRKKKELSKSGDSYNNFKIESWYDTIKPKKQPIDSSKYFYRRFLKLKSQGVPDSLNKFKSKLYHK